MNFFSLIWSELLLFFSNAGKFLLPFIESFMKDEMKMAVASASAAISKVGSDPTYETMSWQDKLSTAVNMVIADCATQGVTIATTAAINAVQAVYTNLKDSSPAK
jgi:hypothetical protein